ncbi:UNVERIFIED_ORG: hypothetical protein J2740_000945 [Rhizobium nepotum]|nr:hypothetical protein [Rhizobium nepotum]
MDKFLEIIGMLGASFVLLTMIIVTSQSRGGSDTAMTILAMLPWALPAIVGCIIIAAFGNMLSQLKAIREASEQQTGLLRTMIESRDSK